MQHSRSKTNFIYDGKKLTQFCAYLKEQMNFYMLISKISDTLENVMLFNSLSL